MMRLIAAVFGKELKDNFRDRRSLGTALVFPILGPVMFLVMMTAMAGWMNEDKPLKIAVVGQDRAPHLMQFLERYGADLSQAPDDYEQKIQDGDLDVAIVVPKEFAEDFTAGKRATVQLVVDNSRQSATGVVHKTHRLLELYTRQLGTFRMLARGVSPEIAAPIDVDEVDLATPAKTAANLLNMIPMFVVMAAFLGGMHLAIDTTAGERERASLEPLLLNPVTRWALAGGKWLSTLVASWIAVAVAMGGFVIAVHRAPLQDLGVKASLAWPEAIAIVAAVLPVTLFAAGLMMVIATFARSFKEAQTYMTALNFAPMIPGMALMMMPFKPALWMMLIPGLAQEVLVSQVMRGEPEPMIWSMVAAASALLFAGMFLGAFVRLLRNEKIIFGR